LSKKYLTLITSYSSRVCVLVDLDHVMIFQKN